MLLAFLITRWKPLAALLVLIALGWCAWLWQPERQVQLHQRHLLEAAQTRNWGKFKPLLAEDFRTSGNDDKAATVRMTAEVLRQFFTLEITASETKLTLEGPEAKLSTRLRISGNGMPFAEAVQEALNHSRDPFEFTWRRQSWKPWDWRLVYAGHSLIPRVWTGEWPL